MSERQKKGPAGGNGGARAKMVVDDLTATILADPPPDGKSRSGAAPSSNGNQFQSFKAQRRLSDETVTTFELAPEAYDGRDGVAYPVAGGRRWKAYRGRPKYLWPDGKPPGATFYHPPDLVEAIEQAGGVIFLVSEADVWALHSAGVHNALAWLDGEASVPADLPDVLEALGIHSAHYWPDLDDAGQSAARRLANVLADSGVDLVVHALPVSLGTGGDVGLAWQSYARPPASFLAWLLSLPRIEIEATPLAKLPPGSPSTTPDGWLASLGAEIATQLGVRRYNRQGWSNLVHCPNPEHEDEHPSAAWNCNKYILTCHVCGTFKAKEVAAWLDIEPPRPAKTGTSLPTTMREALLQRGLGTPARLLDALYTAKWLPGQTFTAHDAVTTSRLATCTVYRALQQKINSTAIFSQNDQFSPYVKSNSDNSRKNRGRPAREYVMPSLSALARMLGVEVGGFSDWLPSDAVRSARRYRVAMYRALIERRPGQYTRAWLGERLGVTGRTVRRYDCDAGVVAHECWSEPERLTSDNVGRFADRLPGTCIVSVDGKRFPANESGLRNALRRSERLDGQAVADLVRRLPNYYALIQTLTDKPGKVTEVAQPVSFKEADVPELATAFIEY